MNENEHETLMSVPEAAKYLGVSPITVWRKLGVKDTIRELGCYRFGHRVFCPKRNTFCRTYIPMNKSREPDCLPINTSKR